MFIEQKLIELIYQDNDEEVEKLLADFHKYELVDLKDNLETLIDLAKEQLEKRFGYNFEENQ